MASPWVLCSVLGTAVQKGRVEGVQRRATKVGKVSEGKVCEEQLRPLGVLSAEPRS